MSLTDHGPCWPDPEVDPDCCPEWAQASVAARTRAAAFAAFILWSLSGRRHGVCTVTVRPCGDDCAGESTYHSAGGGLPWAPMLVSGGWINCGGCGCSGPCDCCHVCKVRLPGIVQDVVQVIIDGVVLDPSVYRVDRHRELVRTDGVCWPRCADQHAPLDEVGGGAFGVTYRRGLPLDDAAMYAYSSYACELLRACSQSDCCRLPERVQTVTRQGVTVAMLDPMEFLDAGRTGIPEVDMWLGAVNPRGLRGRSRVLSPDGPTTRRTTWP